VPVEFQNMGEASKYYVTVAVNRRIIAGRVLIRAANRDVAAQKAEMKFAVRMRDAITIQAVSVQEG
jgi:hypothetical protein